MTVTDFAVGPLADYLAGALPGSGPARLDQIPGGLSNPTYFLDFGGERYVLRKQPPGKLLPSAHAIDREFRVINALADTPVPVPAAPHYCTDAEVIGTPFYVMERLEGRVFHDNALPGLAPGERAAMFEAMNATLAALHAVDIAAAGLDDFGMAALSSDRSAAGRASTRRPRPAISPRFPHWRTGCGPTCRRPMRRHSFTAITDSET